MYVPRHYIRKVTTLLFLLVGLSAAQAHRYFVAITDLNANPNTKSLEIIHEITTHDIELVLTRKHDQYINFESQEGQNFLRDYIAQHFTVALDDKQLDINWIGAELGLEKISIYQEIDNLTSLSGLEISNTILTNEFDEQINTLNYKSALEQGSVIFSGSQPQHRF